jgi:hypothetical protein
MERSNANVEKVKCAISKCEDVMWKLLDKYIQFYTTLCNDKKKLCLFVSEAKTIKKSKNIGDCYKFINKPHYDPRV